jgi:F-type H+-transporting ATPase subunit g
MASPLLALGQSLRQRAGQTVVRSARSHARIRFASSSPTGQAAEKAQQLASETTKKASAAAQSLLSSAQRLSASLLTRTTVFFSSGAGSKVGERASGLLGSYRQPIIYNLQVARELVKQIYLKEGLAPPKSVNEIQEAYKTIWSRAKDANYWRGIVGTGEIGRVGILVLEGYGIFKVSCNDSYTLLDIDIPFQIGEIIGRRSLVGYNPK